MRKTGITGLLKLWRSGDDRAFGRLVAMWQPWLRTQARAIAGKQLKSHLETDDLVQNALTRLVQYPLRYSIEDRHHWVATLRQQLRHAVVAAQRAQDRLRDGGAVEIVSLHQSSDQDQRRAAPLRPSEAFAREENHALLDDAIATLDVEDQVILLLKLRGASMKQMGKALRCPAEAARMRLQRALSRLACAASELRFRKRPV